MSRRILAALTSLAALAFWLLAATPATAIPDGGASPDTKGTAVQVWPKTLVPGDTLNFKVTGFPAGETIYIKIDDGENCSAAAVHGACVIHQQRIPDKGAVQGSFRIPADIGDGKHWLRFLASAIKYGPDGERLGVDPYTLRGNSDFTVTKSTAPPSGQPSTSSPDAGSDPNGTATSPGADPAAPPTTDEPSADEVDGETATGDSQVVAAGEVLTVDLGSAAEPSDTAVPSDRATPAPTTVAGDPGATEVASAADADAGFPLVGVLALVIGLLASVVLLRRPTARG